jgi:N-acetylneuraminic acid mutarotase
MKKHNMVRISKTLIFLKLTCAILFVNIMELNATSKIDVTKLGTIPSSCNLMQLGMAGPSTSILNDKLIIIGGSNFPDEYPWNNGKKKIINDIYIGNLNKNNSIDWIDQNRYTFPVAIYNGVSVSTNRSMFVLGGVTSNGINQIVYRLRFVDQNVLQIDSVSMLPNNFTPTSGGLIGKTFLIVGYSESGNLTYTFDIENFSWQKKKGLPGEIRSEAIVSAIAGLPEDEKLYLFGGRYVNGPLLTIYNDCWSFSLKHNEWEFIGRMKTKENNNLIIMASPIIKINDTKLVLFGGDDGDRFKRRFELEQKIKVAPKNEKEQLKKKLRSEFISHKGFSPNIIVFDTQKKTWKKIGRISTYLLPVCTSALCWNDKIIIPAGEIKPGIRSNLILEIKKEELLHLAK